MEVQTYHNIDTKQLQMRHKPQKPYQINAMSSTWLADQPLAEEIQKRIVMYMKGSQGAQTALRFLKSINENASQPKLVHRKMRDQIQFLLNHEIAKANAMPKAAYAKFDHQGKGYIDIEDFMNQKLVFKLPLEQAEFLRFLKHETIFAQTNGRIRPDQFVKYFMPQKAGLDMNRPNTGDLKADAVDSKSSAPKPLTILDNNERRVTDSITVQQAKDTQKVSPKLMKTEQAIKDKLGAEFTSVRKAWLYLDVNNNGEITGVELARFMTQKGGGQTAAYDMQLVDTIIKMRSNTQKPSLDYHEFIKWVGPSIEAAHGYMFRHDSRRNPQYEIILKKAQDLLAPRTKVCTDLMQQDFNQVKSIFIARVYTSFRTVSKLFNDWTEHEVGGVNLARFTKLMGQWGLTNHIEELFHWLDHDGDQIIKYKDMADSLGTEITPDARLYFRQDGFSWKTTTDTVQPCSYPNCWLDMRFQDQQDGFNLKYCELHTKINNKLALDFFLKLRKRYQVSDGQWTAVLDKIEQDYKCVIKIDLLKELLLSKGEGGLEASITETQAEMLWEAFKLKKREELKLPVSSRSLCLMDAVKFARKMLRKEQQNKDGNADEELDLEAQQINDMIMQEEMQKTPKQAEIEKQLRGFHQVDMDFFCELKRTDKAAWIRVCKALRELDRDQNGFLTMDELEIVFRENYPMQLEGKSPIMFFRKYSLPNDKNFVNYRKMREEIIANNKEESEPDRFTQMTAAALYRLQQSNSAQAPNDTNSYIDRASRRSVASMTSSKRRKASMDDRASNASLPSIRSTSLLRQQDKNVQAVDFNLNKQNHGDAVEAAYGVQVPKTVKMNESPAHRTMHGKMRRGSESVPPKQSLEILHANSQDELPSLHQSRLSGASTRSINAMPHVYQKLAYEWRNIYRWLVQNQSPDFQEGICTMQAFEKACSTYGANLTAREIKKLKIASFDKDSTQMINYLQLSKDFGLHKANVASITRNIFKSSQIKHEDMESVFEAGNRRSSAVAEGNKGSRRQQVFDLCQMVDHYGEGVIPLGDFKRICTACNLLGIGATQDPVDYRQLLC